MFYRIESPYIFTTYTYTMEEALRRVEAAGLKAGEYTITKE